MKQNHTETTNISLEDGQRRRTIVSVNVDDMWTHNKRLEIISRIRNINADIAGIKETHDVPTTKSQLDGYVI